MGLVSPTPPIAKLLRDPTIRALYVWLPTMCLIQKWLFLVCCLNMSQDSGDTGAVLDFTLSPTGSYVSHISAAPTAIPSGETT
jgi:hypothetical protein